MMDPEEYTRKIGQLDAKRILGARAAETLHQMEPVFAELREAYLERLIVHTKANGKPDEYATWALAVLKDLKDLLSEQSSRGASAARKLDRLTDAGGSE